MNNHAHLPRRSFKPDEKVAMVKAALGSNQPIAEIARRFEVIPKDPSLPDYRQGNTLGVEHKYWFRAKFFQQYRLFFPLILHRKSLCMHGSTTKRTNAPMAANRMLTEFSRKCYKPMIGVICLVKRKVVLDRFNQLVRKLL